MTTKSTAWPDSSAGPGEIAVARGRQRNIKGWVARKRAGTKTAAAAEAALAQQAQQAQQGEDAGTAPDDQQS